MRPKCDQGLKSEADIALSILFLQSLVGYSELRLNTLNILVVKRSTHTPESYGAIIIIVATESLPALPVTRLFCAQKKQARRHQSGGLRTGLIVRTEFVCGRGVSPIHCKNIQIYIIFLNILN